MIIWGITSGSAGMVSQVTGVGELLAQKTNSQFFCKKFVRKWPWGALPGYVSYNTLGQLADGSDAVDAELPDVVISSGRRAAPFAIAIRKKAAKRCTIIHLQNPRIAPSFFDMVVAQEHDGLHGENVISTFAALHSVTDKKIKTAAEEFLTLRSFESPRVAVMIGGKTHAFTPSNAAMEKIILQLDTLIQSGASLMITTSRRTLSAHVEMLKAAITGWPKGRVYFYDGQGPNPYLGMLANADFIFVSDDSANMMSEAISTGKPLYVLPWAGHKRSKPKDFANKLIERGYAREFTGELSAFSYPPLDEKKEVVNAIIRVLVRL